MDDPLGAPIWQPFDKREEWFEEIQTFLEARMTNAPDEVCRLLAYEMWEMTVKLEMVCAQA